MSTLNAAATTTRNDGLDALRGLFLVLMTLTHMPTALSSWLGQPFGFVSAAEGFVMLSAFLAGQVYMGRGLKHGPTAMRKALWERAGKVYRHHLALLAFGATVALAIALVTQQEAVTSIFKLYLADPVTTAVAAVLLVHQPALFDILPMYIAFLLFSPWVLGHAMRRGWALPMAISVAIWVAAQMGVRVSFYEGLVALTGLSMPIQATGAFNPFAWQFLWMVGLWLGTARLQGVESRMRAQPRVVVLLAVLGFSFLLWRHTGGQVPFDNAQSWGAMMNKLIDKWDLGPLRLLNLFALTVLVARFGPPIARRLWLQPLSQLGRASLSVFSAHLVCCLLALAVFGPASREDGSAGLDMALLVGSFAILQLTAVLHEKLQSRPAAPVPARTPLTAPRLAPAPLLLCRAG